MNTIINTNFLPILISGILVGAVAGYLGSLMLSRRMTIVVDPLSHLALPGVALALLLGQDISLGAFLFLFMGMLLIWFLETRTGLPTETVIAILFSVSLAITFLFLSEEQIEKALLGDIAKIGFKQAIIIVSVCLIIFLILQKIYQKLVLINISEDLARAEGFRLKKYQLLYLLTIATMVALSVKYVGGLLVAGLTVLPAASARSLVRNLKMYQIFSFLLGACSALLGICLFKITNLAVGPLIIISGLFFFIISLIFKKIYEK